MKQVKSFSGSVAATVSLLGVTLMATTLLIAFLI